MPKVEPPLESQGAPMGAPGPEALTYRRVPPYCWPPAGLEAAGEVDAGLEAGLAVVAAGFVVAGVVDAETVAGWLVTAGAVADKVVIVVVPPLQAVMRMEINTRAAKGTNNFFILVSYLLFYLTI
jgi:hypothetical protein